MADASSLRNAKTLPSPTLRNKGALRFNSTTNVPVYSDGMAWYDNVQVRKFQASYQLAAAASAATKTIFVATVPCRITKISEVREVAEATLAALTLQVYKETGTQSPGGGVSLLSTAFNCKHTAKTVSVGSLVTDDSSKLILNAGDRLSIAYSGTPTSGELAGQVVTVEFETVSPYQTIVASPTIGNDVVETIFTAPVPCVVTGASLIFSTAGTNGSAVTMQVTQETATGAGATAIPGGGTDLLTTAFNLKGTVNTIQSYTFSSPAVLGVGDRISIDVDGTTTAVAGVVLALTVRTEDNKTVLVPFSNKAASSVADQNLFIATSPAIFVNGVATYSTAEGEAATSALERITGTTTVGSGDALTSGATFDLNTTVNTPVVLSAVTTNVATLNTGHRVSLDFSAITWNVVVGAHHTFAIRYI